MVHAGPDPRRRRLGSCLLEGRGTRAEVAPPDGEAPVCFAQQVEVRRPATGPARSRRSFLPVRERRART